MSIILKVVYISCHTVIERPLTADLKGSVLAVGVVHDDASVEVSGTGFAICRQLKSLQRITVLWIVMTVEL